MCHSMTKAYVSQEAIKGMIEDLWDQVKRSDRKFDLVVGIENGGLHISLPLAEALRLPHFSVKISRYDGEQLRSNIVVQDNGFKPQGRSCLIVDDLIDDGGTMLAYQRNIGMGSQDAIVVLFWNTGAPVKPDFYCLNKPKEWIVFPWEVEASLV